MSRAVDVVERGGCEVRESILQVIESARLSQEKREGTDRESFVIENASWKVFGRVGLVALIEPREPTGRSGGLVIQIRHEINMGELQRILFCKIDCSE